VLPVPTDHGLQLEEPQRTGRRTTAVQRSAWLVLALIAVAALAGLLGPGPISGATASEPSGLVQLDYERFLRYQGESSLELEVRPDPEQPDTGRLWISSEYLSAVQVQQVRPEPDTWTGVGDGVVLTFPLDGAEQLDVQLQIVPDRIGVVSGAFGAPGRPTVDFWQFVYP
jgi:hypothetical protein